MIYNLKSHKMKSKLQIYTYISNNIQKIVGLRSNLIADKYERFKYWYYENNLQFNIPIDNLKTLEELYIFLNGESNKYCECGKKNIFKRFTEGYSKFCSKECLHLWRSKQMQGMNNCFFKMDEDTRKRTFKKLSDNLRNRISEGNFTPNITNSWAKSRCELKLIIDGNIKILKYRSSWDAYYQLKNPTFLYEKIRIPYEYNKKYRNYLIDFVDTDKRILYEIKPSSNTSTFINKIKFKAAKKWAKDNNYKFVIITEQWFIDNYDENVLKDQNEKLKRLLIQFKNKNENKKY